MVTPEEVRPAIFTRYEERRAQLKGYAKALGLELEIVRSLSKGYRYQVIEDGRLLTDRMTAVDLESWLDVRARKRAAQHWGGGR